MNRYVIALVILSIVGAAATANGDVTVPLVMANRDDPPEAAIKRILESGRSDRAKRAALARYLKIGDSIDEVRRRIGEEKRVRVDRFHLNGDPNESIVFLVPQLPGNALRYDLGRALLARRCSVFGRASVRTHHEREKDKYSPIGTHDCPLCSESRFRERGDHAPPDP